MRRIQTLAHQAELSKTAGELKNRAESFLSDDRPHGSEPCGRSWETIPLAKPMPHAVGMIQVGNVMAASK